MISHNLLRQHVCRETCPVLLCCVRDTDMPLLVVNIWVFGFHYYKQRMSEYLCMNYT